MKKYYLYALFEMVLLTCTFLSTYCQQTENGNLQADSTALAKLYETTNGHNWNQGNNWATDPIDKWEGVTITSERVTAIRLKNFGLTGQLFSGTDVINLPLGALNQIRTVDLSHNALTGQIPAYWTKLPNLEILDLSYNELESPVPPTIAQFVKSKISLENNRLTFEGLPEAIDNWQQRNNRAQFYYAPQKQDKFEINIKEGTPNHLYIPGAENALHFDHYIWRKIKGAHTVFNLPNFDQAGGYWEVCENGQYTCQFKHLGASIEQNGRNLRYFADTIDVIDIDEENINCDGLTVTINESEYTCTGEVDSLGNNIVQLIGTIEGGPPNPKYLITNSEGILSDTIYDNRIELEVAEGSSWTVNVGDFAGHIGSAGGSVPKSSFEMKFDSIYQCHTIGEQLMGLVTIEFVGELLAKDISINSGTAIYPISGEAITPFTYPFNVVERSLTFLVALNEPWSITAQEDHRFCSSVLTGEWSVPEIMQTNLDHLSIAIDPIVCLQEEGISLTIKSPNSTIQNRINAWHIGSFHTETWVVAQGNGNVQFVPAQSGVGQFDITYCIDYDSFCAISDLCPNHLSYIGCQHCLTQQVQVYPRLDFDLPTIICDDRSEIALTIQAESIDSSAFETNTTLLNAINWEIYELETEILITDLKQTPETVIWDISALSTGVYEVCAVITYAKEDAQEGCSTCKSIFIQKETIDQSLVNIKDAVYCLTEDGQLDLSRTYEGMTIPGRYFTLPDTLNGLLSIIDEQVSYEYETLVNAIGLNFPYAFTIYYQIEEFGDCAVKDSAIITLYQLPQSSPSWTDQLQTTFCQGQAIPIAEWATTGGHFDYWEQDTLFVDEAAHFTDIDDEQAGKQFLLTYCLGELGDCKKCIDTTLTLTSCDQECPLTIDANSPAILGLKNQL